MACVIPDELPSTATQGERRFAAMARRLPEGCLVYYEAEVSGRYPDFILLSPRLGIIVFEIKDWLPSTILSADPQTVTLACDGRTKRVPHPARQATNYLNRLADTFERQARDNPGLWLPLLAQTGRYAGKLRFPINRLAVMTAITADHVDHNWGEAGKALFRGAAMVTADVFARWEGLAGNALLQAIGDARPIRFGFDALRGREVDVLRGVLRPELALSGPRRKQKRPTSPSPSFFDRPASDVSVAADIRALAGWANADTTTPTETTTPIPAAATAPARHNDTVVASVPPVPPPRPPAPKDPTSAELTPAAPTLLDQLRESWANRVRVLTQGQEAAASAILRKGGHHLLIGPPGSGKTVVIVRAAIRLAALHRNRPKPSILILTYNKGIAHALRRKVRDDAGDSVAAIEVATFHAFVRDHYGICFAAGLSDDEAFGAKVLQAIAERQALDGDVPRYQAVLIDEAQTWDGSWLKCAAAHLADDAEACFVLAGDGGQELYGRGHFTWKSVGFRYHNSRRHLLNENRRCPKEVQVLAANFTRPLAPADGGNGAGEGDPDVARIAAIPPAATAALAAGYTPHLDACANREAERAAVLLAVREALAGRWQGTELADGPLDPADIGILYPGLVGGDTAQQHILDLEWDLNAVCPAAWVTRPDFRKRRKSDNAVTIQTIHHATGLEYRLVILLDAHLLPWAGRRGSQSTAALDDESRMLMYVALTRSTELLVVMWSGTGSAYTRRLIATASTLASGADIRLPP